MAIPGRRLLALFALIAVLAIALVAGQSLWQPEVRAVEVPAATGSLRVSGHEPETLDPAFAQDSTTTGYLTHIHAGLVRLDENLEVVPDLAEGWELSPDRRTYTFTLRSEARFQDGRTITAADVKYSLERVADPSLKPPVTTTYLGDIVGVREKLAGQAREVTGIVVLDERRLAITIDSPKVYFLAKLTYPLSSVVDRANVESGREWHKKANGAGLYRLASWNEDWIVLQRSGQHYSQTPAPHEVSFYIGNRSRMEMYERGELDVIHVGLGDIERAQDPRGDLNPDLVVTPGMGLFYLGLNVGMEPFDNRDVRRAFAQAIDKDKLVNVTMKSTVQRADGILPPGLPGHDPSFAGLTFDLEAARRSLAESAYGSGEALPPLTITGGPGEMFAEIFYHNLGAEIEVEVVREGFFQGLTARAYQMFFSGWVADYPDPENFLDVFLHSQSVGNHTGYANHEVDRLLESARVEPDETRRMNLYRQAERIAIDDAALIPLYFDVDYSLVKPRVRGLEFTPLGFVSFAGVLAD